MSNKYFNLFKKLYQDRLKTEEKAADKERIAKLERDKQQRVINNFRKEVVTSFTNELTLFMESYNSFSDNQLSMDVNGSYISISYHTKPSKATKGICSVHCISYFESTGLLKGAYNTNWFGGGSTSHRDLDSLMTALATLASTL